MMKTARDLMTRNVIKVDPDTPVNTLVSILLEHRISSAPVVDSRNNLVGIVTKTDIMAHMMHLDLDLTLKVALKDILGSKPEDSEIQVSSVSELKVRDIMTKEPVTATEDTPVKVLAEIMIDKGIHKIIIVRDKQTVGILSTLDLLHFVAEKEKNG